MMTEYIADFDKITSYWVNLEFSKIIKPSILYNDPLQFVSIKTEIDANTFAEKAKQIYKKYRRIPYGSPIYIYGKHIRIMVE